MMSSVGTCSMSQPNLLAVVRLPRDSVVFVPLSFAAVRDLPASGSECVLHSGHSFGGLVAYPSLQNLGRRDTDLLPRFSAPQRATSELLELLAAPVFAERGVMTHLQLGS